ncbi:MAG TPA: hypothetical protein DD670_09070, partial [Planctomycetaceae bacterium]|nr:hypothetical protein [Planctomycetaceae bacterium]
MMNRLFKKMRLGLMALALAGLALASSATADVALQDGLIGYWAFDEGVGTTVADSIGGANGTVTGGTWATGKFNGGFDHYDYWGTPDGVAIGNPASLDIATNAVTLSTWVYLPTMPEFQPEAFVGIYDSLADGYGMYLDRTRKEIRMKVTSVRDPLPGETPSVWGDIQVGYARAGVDQANLTLNTWHHVVGTFDGTYVKMYCDGQLMSTVGLNAVGEKLRVGQYASMGYEMADPGAATPADRYAWDGKMDDTAIWNRALNANEIAYLYNEGTGRTVTSTNPIITPPDPPSPTLPNPVVHW